MLTTLVEARMDRRTPLDRKSELPLLSSTSFTSAAARFWRSRKHSPHPAHKRRNHGHDHSERRYANLLQGLGHWPATVLPSRLAALSGRLGRSNDVLSRPGVPGDRT